jgi:hypothetical protein
MDANAAMNAAANELLVDMVNAEWEADRGGGLVQAAVAVEAVSRRLLALMDPDGAGHVPAPTTPNPDVDPDSLPYTNAVLAMLLPATAQATLPPILARWGGSNVHADLTGTADSPRLLPAPAWPRGCFQRQLGPAAASSASLAPGQICGSGSRQVHGSVEPFAEAVHKEEDGNPGDMPGDEGDSEDSEPLLMTVSLGEMQTCVCEHVKVEHLFTIPGEEFPRCHECVKPFRGKKATHKKAPPVLVLLHVQDEAKLRLRAQRPPPGPPNYPPPQGPGPHAKGSSAHGAASSSWD